MAPYRDVEIASRYKRAYSRIFSDPKVRVNVRTEFGLFISAKDVDPIVVNDQSRMDGITWWLLHGQEYL